MHTRVKADRCRNAHGHAVKRKRKMSITQDNNMKGSYDRTQKVAYSRRVTVRLLAFFLLLEIRKPQKLNLYLKKRTAVSYKKHTAEKMIGFEIG
jgi:hypothetical protein